MTNKDRLVNYLQKYAAKGEPKRDGSGGGVNANKGRGGCSEEEQKEKASERSRRNANAPRSRNATEVPIGVPKRDGSGRGVRANEDRGECSEDLSELLRVLSELS